MSLRTPELPEIRQGSCNTPRASVQVHRSLSPWLSPTKPAFTRSAETLSTKVTQEKAVILNSAATETPTCILLQVAY